MQIRNAILIAGTALAIVAPSATARVAPDPIGDGSGTAHAKVFATTNLRAGEPRFLPGVEISTENSFGQSKHSQGTLNAANKRGRAKVASARKSQHGGAHVVTYIVEPALSPSTTVPNLDATDCESNAAGCTDEQLCTIWGENCDQWYTEQATQVAARGDQSAN